MSDTITTIFDRLQEETESNYEYLSIQVDYREAEAEYLKLYRQLTPDQQETLTEYIGKLSECYQRLLELLAEMVSS